MEIWKDINGFEGIYQVSTHGNVRSLDRFVKIGHKLRFNKGGMMAFTCDTDGYFQLSICKDAKVYSVKVHRLVAETFIPNTDNKPIPNHINGLKQINHYKNLEWSTHSENTQHSYDTGLHVPLMGEKHQNSKLKDGDILEIRRLHSTGMSQCSIGRLYKVRQSMIGKIVNKLSWKHI